MSLIPPWTISDVGILGAIREAYCDLVGSLAEDAAVGKVELGILLRSPVLELALLVFAETELLSHLRVRVIER